VASEPADELRRYLVKFRTQHGARPGQVWDPAAGCYRDRLPGDLPPFQGSRMLTYQKEPQCRAISDAPLFTNMVQGLARERCGCITCQKEMSPVPQPGLAGTAKQRLP